MERKAAVGRLYVPMLVVLLVSLSLSLQMVALYHTLSPAATEWVIDLVVILWVGYIGWGLALWALASFVLYVLSSLVGGKPLMGHIVRVVGWGMVPLVPAGVVWSAGKYLVYEEYTLSEPNFSDVAQQNAVFTDYTAQAAGDPLLVGTTVLGCLFLVGTAYVWTAGLVTASALPRRKAALVSVTVAGAYALSKLVAVV